MTELPREGTSRLEKQGLSFPDEKDVKVTSTKTQNPVITATPDKTASARNWRLFANPSTATPVWSKI